MSANDAMTVPVFLGDGRIGFEERPIPRPGERQLLLRIGANALCGSERHQFYSGSAVTPGHEAAGVVAAVGPETTVKVGTKGVVYLMDYCGTCRNCLEGWTNQCLEKRGDMGFSRDGGYAPFELVSENTFFPIDPDIPLTDATLLLDVISTANHALGRATLVRPGFRSLYVAGAGPVGLGVVAVAKIRFGDSLRLFASDLSPYRLALAERLGAIPINPQQDTVHEALERKGLGAVDVAVDTTGKTVARESAVQIVDRRGVLVCVGHGEGLTLSVSRDLIAPERAVMGSEYFPYGDLSNSVRLLREHGGLLGQIVTHRFPVNDLQQAFETFFAGETGKVVAEQ